MTHSWFAASVATVALLQAAAEYFEEAASSASFGNRLNLAVDDEYLYSYFLRQHRDFNNAVAEAIIPDGHITCLDVWRYYDSIRLDELYLCMSELLGEQRRRALSAWQRHVLCCESVTGVDPINNTDVGDRGVPQGHPTSGALANLYLNELDEHVCSEGRWPERFFRYVDDMRVISTPEQGPDSAREAIEGVLSQERFSLKLNQNKTCCYPCAEHQHDHRDDLNDLSRRCHGLVRQVYRLPGDYASVFRDEQWEFCCGHSRMLRSIGIHISPRHLIRKLQREAAWGTRITRVFDKPLRLPPLPQDGEGLDGWASESEALNGDWVAERAAVATELKDLAQTALQESRSGSDEEEKKRAARSLRFAAFRLTQIEAEDCGDLCAELVAEPWLAKPSHIANGLAIYGMEHDLVAGIQSTNETVAACCARAAGEYGIEAAREELWALTAQGQHPLARSAAVVALVRLGTWNDDELESARDAIGNEQDPIPLSALIALGGAMDLADIEQLGRQAYLRTRSQRVLDAWTFARKHSGENLLAGPDEPPPHYSEKYPDFEGHPDYYGLMY